MNSTSCMADEKFEVDVHRLSEEQLQELAKILGLTVEEHTLDDGKVFKTVNWKVGELTFCFYT